MTRLRNLTRADWLLIGRDVFASIALLAGAYCFTAALGCLS